MLLAIDCGNTNAVFAVYDGDRRVGAWRSATDPRRTGDEYAVWLVQLLKTAGLSPDDITGAIIGSVVPQATFNLKRLCVDHFGCAPLIVGDEGVDPGIAIAMPRPGEVGADRLVNALAAVQSYGAPLIVVDFGTATTFDVVDEAGAYVGGVIAPGINLSLDALHQAAARLPRVEIARADKVVGDDTVSAMQSGIYWGYVSLIEGIVTRVRAEIGRDMKVIATGGLSGLFAGATDAIDHTDNDLTERGLRLVWQANSKKAR